MSTAVDTWSSLFQAAFTDAEHLSAQAGVEIRMLERPDDMSAASALLARVWRVSADRSHIDPGMLVALAHAHNYVSGAFADGVLVAVCVGFFHPPEDRSLHSHITGVESGLAGTGIGRAIKSHQRAWALSRGARTITWTFDPLMARNAYFNLHRLGARAVRYLPDFYGAMTDGINAGQESDRMLVAWDLTTEPAPGSPDLGCAQPVLVSRADRPVRRSIDGGSPIATVGVPTDIEDLRRRDPAAAAQWRREVRSALVELLADGWTIVDFQRDGTYVLEKGTP